MQLSLRELQPAVERIDVAQPLPLALPVQGILARLEEPGGAVNVEQLLRGLDGLRLRSSSGQGQGEAGRVDEQTSSVSEA